MSMIIVYRRHVLIKKPKKVVDDIELSFEESVTQLRKGRNV